MKTGLKVIKEQLEALKASGVYSEERVLTVPQGSKIDTLEQRGVINMCANNYLGLANDQELIEAAKASYDRWGYGLSSVRFICGTQTLHKKLEEELSHFFGFEDCILYSSCFDANGGLFETILGAEDAVISDELNHASIIDGIRLCKAKRYLYKNNDMAELEARLREAEEAGCRVKLIATDGVFRWTVSLRILRIFVIWRINTTHLSWLMTLTRPVLWAKQDAVPELKMLWDASIL